MAGSRAQRSAHDDEPIVVVAAKGNTAATPTAASGHWARPRPGGPSVGAGVAGPSRVATAETEATPSCRPAGHPNQAQNAAKLQFRGD